MDQVRSPPEQWESFHSILEASLLLKLDKLHENIVQRDRRRPRLCAHIIAVADVNSSCALLVLADDWLRN